MSYFNIVSQSDESTVVAEYTPQSQRSEAYQSEAELENEFIRLLCELGYERLAIHKEADLIANLRTQLEKLNDYRFTDGECSRSSSSAVVLKGFTWIQVGTVSLSSRRNAWVSSGPTRSNSRSTSHLGWLYRRER